MSPDQVSDASRPTPPVRHEWVAGPADARRLAGAIAIRSLGTARVVILMVIVVAAVAALIGPRWALVEAAVLLVLLPLAAWLRTYLRLRRTVGPGRRWRTGYDADGILIENADATTVLAYHTVRSITPFGPVVAMRIRRLGLACYPAPLFPLEAVAFIRERLAATASPH